jgi:ATP-binding cassette, subfamily B, bacterial
VSLTRRAPIAVAGIVSSERASGRQAWSLLWTASHRLGLLVGASVVVNALMPALVVGALGVVVGFIPGAVEHGMGSAAGSRLIGALILAGLLYAFSLVLDPIAGALGTAANARITGALQGRLLAAVSGPVGIAHLEDSAVLDRLSRAEGSLSGFFPGDAPVTWAGVVANRIAGVVGCIVVAIFQWWLGLLLLVMWLGVRRLMIGAVIRQATELRGQTTVMRRAWYFIALGTKARDAKEIRVFDLKDFVGGRYRHEQRGANQVGTQGLRALHRRAFGCLIVVLATYVVALSLLAHDASHGEISLRSLAILLPMLAVTMSAGSIGLDDITLAWSMAALPDVDRLEADLARSQADLAGQRQPHGPHESVRFNDVSFRYPSGSADVLAGLNLELRAGTSTAIVGANGAGKSTLVSLLSRWRDPTAGSITVDGVDISDFDPESWQRSVSIMPQEPVRYPVSAYDNIAFGALEHRDDVAGIEECARLSGFAEVVASLPDGWDTVLARQLPGGSDLSGGQWQRLALARALFATRHGARILVLDEPTAALDVRSEAQFYGRFLEVTRGLTTVVISHRFPTVRRADVICVLDNGSIAERGSHDELLAAGGTYANLYRLQAARFGGAK